MKASAITIFSLTLSTQVCLSPDGKRYTNVVCPVDLENMPEKTLPDIQSTEYAVDFLKNISTEADADAEPFFLAVGYHKPHIPLKYPKQYKGEYKLISTDRVLARI